MQRLGIKDSSLAKGIRHKNDVYKKATIIFDYRIPDR